MPDNQTTTEFDRYSLFFTQWDGKAEEVFKPSSRSVPTVLPEDNKDNREDTIQRLIDRIKTV